MAAANGAEIPRRAGRQGFAGMAAGGTGPTAVEALGGRQRRKPAIKISLEVFDILQANVSRSVGSPGDHFVAVRCRSQSNGIRRMRLSKPPLVPRPAVTSLVSSFCWLDGALFGKLMRLHYPRRFAAATT